MIVEDENVIKDIAKIAGDSMTQLMDDGRFWKQYRKYFRFSEEEIEKSRMEFILIICLAYLKTVC
ncbi:MAG: hypothetical protein IPN57_03200 [Ignavibacteria bacterium]|nr:hypothetical protein [Ignavibacteria bacterium]